MKAAKAFVSVVWLLIIALFAGWVNNVMWTFEQTDTTNLVLGILGAVLGPIGAIHGVYLWFV